MHILFIEYPACSTCRKAKKWLKDAGVELEVRHIMEDTPTVEELRTWWKRSHLKLTKFFNTSGKLYRELNLKERLKDMNEEEQLQLLSSNGMLIKRPIVVCDEGVLLGFKEDIYKKICSD